MSPNDERDKLERSLKLIQLIYDRQIDCEIGIEIRKLLEEGVFIDFQDQNRNKKTALHIAVEKCDVICVKVLLQFKPSLEVTDENGKTPIELARSKGFQNILNVLLNSSFDVVNESYVEVIDFEMLTRQKIEAIKLRPTFKVLKLINFTSVNEVLGKITHRAYTTTFNESSHLFFIAIETNKMSIEKDDELIKKVLNLRRPMIVQLSSSMSQNIKIYFKDEKEDFVEISATSQITQEQFNQAAKSEDNCNMKLLVAALRSNIFGHFTGDLLLTKLNTNECRSEAVNNFARSNVLCHRFFKLFDESQPKIDRIIAALSFKGDQSLMALLDLPFELKEEKLQLTEHQQDIMRIVDCCGCNLLMLAAELKNLDAVKLLLRSGCDFNQADSGNHRASDICWDVKAFDCLAELIEAGSPYPYHFSADELDESSEANKRINAMTEAINSFHENIKDGKIEEVKKFITSHPHINHAYDTKNFCALTVALQSDEVEIYSLLMSNGFEPGADDDEYQSTCSKSKFKYEITNSHRKYFKEAFDEPHLKRLLNKYRLSFGSKDRAKCSTIIRGMFDELNEFDEIIPILQICSTSNQLRIVFDFNCNSVVDMDPNSGSSSLGAVYPSGGFVYIGAKNHETEFCKVIGTLIHELTHYAMKLNYENSCKPYDEDDNDKSKQFENISIETKKICDENHSTDSIVTTVFKYYKIEVWHAELIVRVPQLLAHYKMNPKAFEVAERNTPDLFHFYREKTLKDVATKSKVLLQKYLISKINKQTGIARKIENMNVEFENGGVIELKPFNVITSNAPQLTLAMLKQFDCDDSNIFMTLEQVSFGNILDKIGKVNSKEKSTTLIVDCIGHTQKYLESVRKLGKIKNMKTIALVMTEDEGSIIKLSGSKVEPKIFTHKWTELTESSKVQNVIFQGVKMALNKLVEPSSEAMNFFPLGDILDCKDFQIGSESHQNSHNFYIERKLIRRNRSIQSNAKGFEELIKDEPTKRVMIISDDAGSGKSVTLFEIAKSLRKAFPDQWVLFVDLKRHIETFKGVEDCRTIKTFQDFISHHILKDDPKFDRELFMQMFRDGKTFVLFDGFDEISPNYKDLLLHVLKMFDRGSGNRIYITTRPHLEADLKEALGRFVFKLEEFSKKSRTSFLREYWQSVGFEIINEDFKVLSQRLLEKFSETAISNIVGLPLLLRMTAEIFSDPIKENMLHKVDSLSITSIFKEFVDKYLARWKLSGNEIALKENVEIDRDGGILEIHHSIAIKHKFRGKFTVLEVDESDAEKIARVGLIRYDKIKKTFQFIHETFAEYFVADFICFHLQRKNRNPMHDCRTAIEIFVELETAHDFKVIHTFLDQTLETTKLNLNEASCKSLGKCISKVVESRNCFGILSDIFAFESWGHEKVKDRILILLLSLVKFADKKVLLKMLESKDKGYEGYERTALLNAAKYKSTEIVSTLCDIIATRVDNPKKIFQQKYERRGSENVLFMATESINHGVLTALCEGLKAVFADEEIKKMFQYRNTYGQGDNIICYAAHMVRRDIDRMNDEVLYELISLLRKYLSADELKSLVVAFGGADRNCLQYAAEFNTNVVVKTLIDLAKSLLDTENLKIFLQQDFWGNIFHLAAKNRKRDDKIFQTFIESTCDVLSSDEIKSMLMGKRGNSRHEFHSVENENVLKSLMLVLLKYLSEDEIRSLSPQVKGEDDWLG